MGWHVERLPSGQMGPARASAGQCGTGRRWWRAEVRRRRLLALFLWWLLSSSLLSVLGPAPLESDWVASRFDSLRTRVVPRPSWDSWWRHAQPILAMPYIRSRKRSSLGLEISMSASSTSTSTQPANLSLPPYPRNTSAPASMTSSRAAPKSPFHTADPSRPRPLPARRTVDFETPRAMPLERRVDGDADDAAYHVFSAARKRQLTILVSVSGLFLSLSGSIYLPALVAISKAMQVDTHLVFLSVSVYMVVQSLASAMWGPLSDALGRRCVFLAALVAYGVSNVGLVLSTRYHELMGFRALQAAGTAAVMSVGAGVVADYTEPAERASHLGLLGAARLLGQSFGPVLGGLLEQNFGFRSIFYLLLVLGLVALLLLLVFLPETNRAIAGNGTVTLGGIIHRPLMYAVTGQPHVSPSSTSFSSSLSSSSSRPTMHKRHHAPSLPMLGLGEKDILATVIFAGVITAVWYAVSCTTGLVLQAQFGLTDLQVGLCFLPGGAGGALGSWVAGWALSGPCSLPTTTRNRLRHAPLAVVLLVACVAGYGWAANASTQQLPEAAVLGPLALQFLASMASGAVSTQSGTLATDLFPQGAGASAAAAGVLVRGLAGAAAVAGVTYALAVQQAGFVFVEFSAAGAIISGALLCMLWAWGAEWRGDRDRRRLKKTRASLEDARRVARRHHGE